MKANLFFALPLLAVSLLLGSHANAAFHHWDITQIFSNSSGTVQYIQLLEVNGSNNQHQLNGHEVTSSDGSTTLQYDFNSNLGSNQTAGQSFLIATSGYETLPGSVAADFIMPDGFLFSDGGTLNFAGVDIWAHSALPTDGINALFRNGSTGPNSQTNFAGSMGSISAVPLPAAAWFFLSALGSLGLARRNRL